MWNTASFQFFLALSLTFFRFNLSISGFLSSSLFCNASFSRSFFISKYRLATWKINLLLLQDSLQCSYGRASRIILWNVYPTRRADSYPTSPFTILEPHNPRIVEFYAVQERRATNFKAPKLWRGSSGTGYTTRPSISQFLAIKPRRLTVFEITGMVINLTSIPDQTLHS